MSGGRQWRQFIFTFDAGETVSDRQSLVGGAFGTLLVPAALDGNTVNVITDIGEGAGLDDATEFNAVPLLSTGKTLATGANAFSSDEIAEVGAAGHVRLELGTAAVDRTQIVLWWKE